jgi:hypothetical protein
MRPLLTAMPTPSPATGTPMSSTGLKIRLKSRTKRAQNLTVAAMLQRQRHQHLTPTRANTQAKGTYLAARRTRSSSILYTPARSASFSTRMTGPSSGSTNGHPLVEKSGSVAARKMAPATRGTGVIGMPASISFTGRSRMDVSSWQE